MPENKNESLSLFRPNEAESSDEINFSQIAWSQPEEEFSNTGTETTNKTLAQSSETEVNFQGFILKLIGKKKTFYVDDKLFSETYTFFLSDIKGAKNYVFIKIHINYKLKPATASSDIEKLAEDIQGKLLKGVIRYFYPKIMNFIQSLADQEQKDYADTIMCVPRNDFNGRRISDKKWLATFLPAFQGEDPQNKGNPYTGRDYEILYKYGGKMPGGPAKDGPDCWQRTYKPTLKHD